MTTLPPLLSSRVQRLAGSAETSAGTAMTGGGGTYAGVADLAAIRPMARKGNATKRLFMSNSHPSRSGPTIAAPALFQLRRDIFRHGMRDELVDRAAIAGDFFHQP